MIILDVEADGLLDEATKIHVLSYTRNGKDIISLHDYDDMRKLLLSEKHLVGHNFIMYDIPLLEKILDIKITAKVWDTLPISWYINHDRIKHGLEEYGESYGVPKPKIDDWSTLSREEYTHRCEEDVKINWRLWRELRSYLLALYTDRRAVERICDYLAFKMDCAREQSRSKWKVDLERVQRNIDELEKEQELKISQLIGAMPVQEVWVSKTRPAKPFKKDGTYSVTGAKWFALVKSHGFDEDYEGPIDVKVEEKPANPNSVSQVKEWLLSLGWEPTSFNYVKDEDGSEREIAQVRVDGDDGKELCQSVLTLADEHPEIKLLEGLTVIQHRLGIFKNFMKYQRDGYLKAEIHGLTNTLRFKHRNPLVNLPGVDKPYGEEIRGSLIAPDGMVLCGSDMVSLEDNTKRHYMWDYDPDYVIEMSQDGFDPHLDLALHAGAVTQSDIDEYNGGTKPELKAVRKDYKVANYSCIYGVGGPKLSRTIGSTVAKAKKLIEAYWKRNWSIKQLMEDTTTKTVKGKLWLYNPVSGFWYSLRYEKDIFSTLNQGTGVYCFDTWIRHFRKVRSQLTGQFHDEIIACIPEGKEEQYEKILREAIDKTNNQLKLNITLDIDVQFGKTYADIH